MFKLHLKKQKTVLYSIFKKPLSDIKSAISSCVISRAYAYAHPHTFAYAYVAKYVSVLLLYIPFNYT